MTRLVYCGICERALDAHWTHGRAGYRCRHGRTSSRPADAAPQHILYCREDHLVELLQCNPKLLQAHPRLRNTTARTAAEVLRQHGMILVGDHENWTVETNGTTITLTAAPLPKALQARIPAQRDGDQE
ncbi:hypothetical protein ACIBSW_16840 [Actinoplanes sp. NPDC049668]|uniref:hypothetical protein n=1 Tax=unclassified Actinoplanes TaxID=2626549 RepID=UPI0033B5F39E